MSLPRPTTPTIVFFFCALALSGTARGDFTQVASFVYVPNAADDTITIHRVDRDTGRLVFAGYHSAAPGEDAPEAAVVHPGGEFLYVPNLGDGVSASNVSVYTIDSATGQLEARSPVVTGIGPHGIALDAAGEFAYVTSQGSDHVSVYAIDPVTGDLTPVGSPVATGQGPRSIALDPLGRFAFVGDRVSRTISIYDVDSVTGALSASLPAVDLSNGLPTDFVLDDDGSHLYVTLSNFSLLATYSVDPSTGDLTFINVRATGLMPNALALRPKGDVLWVANRSGDSLSAFRVDAVTGLATIVPGSFPAGDAPIDVAFDPSGLYAQVVCESSFEVQSFRVDGLALTPIPIGSTRTRGGPAGVALRGATGPVAARSRHLYALDQTGEALEGFSVDPSDGSLTGVGGGVVATGALPTGIAVDPFGRFVWVVDAGDDTLSTYTVDAGTGQLVSAGAATPVAGQAQAVAVDPTGRWLYVASGAIDFVVFYEVDPVTGVPSVLGGRAVGADPRTVSIDPTGQFVYVTRATGDIDSFRVADGGFAGGFASVAAPGNPARVSFSTSGLYAYVPLQNLDLVVPYSIDPASGALTSLPPGNGTGDQPMAVATHPGGEYAYAAILGPAGTGRIEAFRINDQGALVDAGNATGGTNPRDVLVDHGGARVYAANGTSGDVSRFDVDPATGALAHGADVAAGTFPVALGATQELYAPPPPDCDNDGTPDHDEIAAATATDCNGNAVPDDCEIADGSALDCDLNGFPDECDPDCDGDGLPDACEIDCNSNGIPDECEVFADCNQNDIPDSCDIDSGFATDTDMNGIPDHCECGSGVNYCMTSPHSAGPGALIGWSGPLDISLAATSLTLTAGPPFKFGIFFYGPAQVSTPFGDGVRCVGAGGVGVFRLYPLIVLDAAGAGSLSINFSGGAAGSGPGAINPGSTWNFQFWFRDPQGGPVGYNTSDAVSLTFCP